MSSIHGIFEIAIPVRELARAEAFYCNVLGFAPGLRDERRNWIFLWVGEREGMVVLQETADAFRPMHFAFRVAKADLADATKSLQEHSVKTTGPIHHAWMGADSLYFTDPDGHELELCALD
jgi:catechol-2,3-dioxygenase